MHLAVAVALVVLPVAFIVVLGGVDHLTLAPLHATLPEPRVNRAILITKLAMAVTHSILPVAIVLDTLALVDVFAFTVAQTVQNVTLVGALVRPGVSAFAGDLVFFKLTAVDRAISPLKDSAAPKQTQTQLALVLVPIFECASTVTVVDFADLKKSK